MSGRRKTSRRVAASNNNNNNNKNHNQDNDDDDDGDDYSNDIFPSSSASLSSRSSRSSRSAAASGSETASKQPPVRSSRTKKGPNYKIDESSENEDDDETNKIPAKSNKSTSSSMKKVDMDKLAKLEAIAGLSRSEAMQLLEASGNDLERAMELHFSEPPPRPSNPPPPSAAAASASAFTNGRKRSSEKSQAPPEDNNYAVDGDDTVRAPIPQKIDRMLDYDPYALAVGPQSKRMRGVFDSFQTSGGDGDSASASGTGPDGEPKSNSVLNHLQHKKQATLTNLYQPPIDLLFVGSFEASKTRGCERNKWVMLNVQNQQDFACQCLNRDVWKDSTVKEIVRANFIFVQIYFDSAEGAKLINYYQIQAYPFVGIVDPRTGEKLVQFNAGKTIDQMVFCEKVTNFLCDYETPIEEGEDASKYLGSPPASSTAAKKTAVDTEAEVVQIDDDSQDTDIIQTNRTNKTNGTNGTNGTRKLKQSKLYPSASTTPKKSTASDILKDDPDLVEITDEDNENDDDDDEDDEDFKISSVMKSSKSSSSNGLRSSKPKKKTTGDESSSSEISSDSEDEDEDENEDAEDCVTSKDAGATRRSARAVNNNNKKQEESSSNTNFRKQKTPTKKKPTLAESPEKTVKPRDQRPPEMDRFEDPDATNKNCTLRILFPNSGRCDFVTSGDSKLKVLTDHLKVKYEYCESNGYELIERLMPGVAVAVADVDKKNQSRDLFKREQEQLKTFKELDLFPRTVLMILDT